MGWADPPSRRRRKNFDLNKTPLDKEDFEVEVRGFLYSNPMYQYHPKRDVQQTDLGAQVKNLKEKGAKIKKERQKQRVKFECPYIDL